MNNIMSVNEDFNLTGEGFSINSKKYKTLL
jgi:hypothetical protein